MGDNGREYVKQNFFGRKNFIRVGKVFIFKMFIKNSKCINFWMSFVKADFMSKTNPFLLNFHRVNFFEKISCATERIIISNFFFFFLLEIRTSILILF